MNETAYHFARDPEIDARVDDWLDAERLRFCRDPNYRFWPDDKAELCPHVEAWSLRCPEMKNACARPAFGESWETSEPASGFWDDLARFLGTTVHDMARIAFFAILAIAVVWLVRALARRLRDIERARENDRGARADAPRAELELDRESSLELLERARRSLDRGETRRALDEFYRAMIAALGERGLVVPHRSKTTREYVGELEPELRTEVAELTRTIDELRFQTEPVTEDDARSSGGRVRSFVERLVPVALALLVLSSSACGGDEGVPENPNDPRSPHGTLLFEELVADQAAGVRRRIRRIASVPDDTSAVIVFEGARLHDVEWQALARFVLEGGHLVVSGAPPSFDESFPWPLTAAPCEAPIVAPDLALQRTGTLAAYAPIETAIVLARCGDSPLALHLPHGEGSITAIAEPSVFENHFLLVADHATLLLELVGDSEGVVELVGPWTGSGADNPLESLLASGLGPFTLHLLIALGLFAWATGKSFGRPKEPDATARRSFVEHARALAGQYAARRASGFALERYAEYLVELSRRRAPSESASTEHVTRSLARGDGALARELTLARKAGELGESEKTHEARFDALERAIDPLRPVRSERRERPEEKA